MERRGTGWIPDYPDLSDYTLDSAGQKLAKQVQSQGEVASLETLAQKVCKALDALADLPVDAEKKDELTQLREILEIEILGDLEFVAVDFHDVLRLGNIDEEVLTIRGYLNSIKNKYSDFLVHFHEMDWHSIFSRSDEKYFTKGDKYYSVDYTNRMLTQDVLVFVSNLLSLQVTYLLSSDDPKIDANTLEKEKRLDCIELEDREYLKCLAGHASSDFEAMQNIASSWNEFLKKGTFPKTFPKEDASRAILGRRKSFLIDSTRVVKLVAHLSFLASHETKFSKACEKFDRKFHDFYRHNLYRSFMDDAHLNDQGNRNLIVSFDNLKQLWLQIGEAKQLLEEAITLVLRNFSGEIEKIKGERVLNVSEKLTELNNLNDSDQESHNLYSDSFYYDDFEKGMDEIYEIEKSFIDKLVILSDDPSQQGRDLSEVQKKLELIFQSGVDIAAENFELEEHIPPDLIKSTCDGTFIYTNSDNYFFQGLIGRYYVLNSLPQVPPKQASRKKVSVEFSVEPIYSHLISKKIGKEFFEKENEISNLSTIDYYQEVSKSKFKDEIYAVLKPIADAALQMLMPLGHQSNFSEALDEVLRKIEVQVNLQGREDTEEDDDSVYGLKLSSIASSVQKNIFKTFSPAIKYGDFNGLNESCKSWRILLQSRSESSFYVNIGDPSCYLSNFSAQVGSFSGLVFKFNFDRENPGLLLEDPCSLKFDPNSKTIKKQRNLLAHHAILLKEFERCEGRLNKILKQALDALNSSSQASSTHLDNQLDDFVYKTNGKIYRLWGDMSKDDNDSGTLRFLCTILDITYIQKLEKKGREHLLAPRKKPLFQIVTNREQSKGDKQIQFPIGRKLREANPEVDQVFKAAKNRSGSHNKDMAGDAKDESPSDVCLTLPDFVDLSYWFSPIEDQGNLNSCTAHAGNALIEYAQRKNTNAYVDASPRFLYKATRNLMGQKGDSGASMRDTMKAMVSFGVCPEEHWPFNEEKFDEDPPAFCYSFAQNYKALKYFRLDHGRISQSVLLAQVKVLLVSEIPCAFGFTLYDSAYEDSNFKRGHLPLPTSRDKVVGGHVVVAVGYHDRKIIKNSQGDEFEGALLIRNSWGRGWGQGGYGWMPYDYVLKGLTADWWSLLKAEWLASDNFSAGASAWSADTGKPRGAQGGSSKGRR